MPVWDCSHRSGCYSLIHKARTVLQKARQVPDHIPHNSFSERLNSLVVQQGASLGPLHPKINAIASLFISVSSFCEFYYALSILCVYLFCICWNSEMLCFPCFELTMLYTDYSNIVGHWKGKDKKALPGIKKLTSKRYRPTKRVNSRQNDRYYDGLFQKN